MVGDYVFFVESREVFESFGGEFGVGGCAEGGVIVYIDHLGWDI